MILVGGLFEYYVIVEPEANYNLKITMATE
jgi:hypothetical protein